MSERLSSSDAVAAAAPSRDAGFTEQRFTDSVVELADAIRASGARPSVRRLQHARRTRAALIAVAVLVIVPVTTALAYEAGARTGVFGAPGQTENDQSEFLRSDARDFGRVIGALTPTVPLPGGASWSAAIAAQVEQGRTAGGLVQVTGVRSTFESYARCAWIRSWGLASERGDVPAARRAARVIADSATWPATAASDGGGVVAYIQSLARAAHAGDASPLRNELAVNCTGFDLRGVQ